MKKLYIFVLVLCFLPFTSTAQKRRKKAAKTQTPYIKSDDFKSLKWRNIGPFRGGRSVTSSGVVSQPRTYYMGGTGGGVFKTTDDGINWKNISDGFFKTGSVGAIAVSESNPNIVVVGMGEHPARGVMTSVGDGVYKSTDAGKTWKHIGLDNTRHISDVVIHPTNPDIIFITAQGAQYAPSKDRGVYRTKDGGKTWEKVLYVNDITGASSLSMDMNNPEILYAAMWEHQRFPWTMVSGGKGSGFYKSTDGGTTWNQLKKGLPEVMGKTGLSVSRANSNVIYAVIEAEGKKAGVYKSTDAGKSWKQTSGDRKNITRSWYYMEIFADPQNENIVYVANAPVTRSIDGGRTFQRVSTPHGDNHHIWIHPDNNQIMINSNDGGANISNDGGKSWSTQKNQPTSQFYRVITDNLVPYNVYAGQQDNSSVKIASRTTGSGIGWKDWEASAGCESAYLAFDPDNPEIVYGGCYQGIINIWDAKTKHRKSIKEYPELGLGGVPKDFKYRYNWNAPIISSPHNRNTIYHAGNVVFKTSDQGHTWEVVSPDLTRNEKDKQGVGGKPFTNEAAGGENYNTIMYLTESQHEKGVLYAGTDDGLVHITKDGGANWANITPKGMPRGIVNSIEVSPHDPATAYMVMMNYKTNDLKPYVYKTNNYGQTWTKITNGFNDPHGFVRVVRADKKRKGLLYAGAETGLYVSFNDGASWEQFQLNLPVVAINDLTIQDNDLIVATAGRSFWILDDVSALQEYDPNEKGVKIYKPKDTYRLFGRGGFQAIPGSGQNPRSGVTFDYHLPKLADSIEVKLEVLDNGKVIRTYSSNKNKKFKTWEGGPSKPQILPAKKGYNRFTWDFKREGLPAVKDVFMYGGFDGVAVPPGTYTLRLSANGQASETQATILADPNIPNSAADLAEQQEVLGKITNAITQIHEAVTKMRSAKSQIATHKKLLKDNSAAKDLIAKGNAINKKIDAWERELVQPDQKTFQDVINQINQLNAHLSHLKGFVDGPEAKVTNGAKERLADLLKQWSIYKAEQQEIMGDMNAYNDAYKALNLPAVIVD